MSKGLLHIGFLTNEYIIPPRRLDGGLATYIQKVGRGLVAGGHKVSVFCLSNRNFDWMDGGVHVYEVRSESRSIQRAVRSISLPAGSMEKTFTNSSSLAKRLWEVHKTEPLDIIQAASYYAVGIALCRNGKIPLVTRISSIPALTRNAATRKSHNSLDHALTDWCEMHQVENSESAFSPSLLMARYARLLSKAAPVVIRSPVDLYNENLDDSFYEQNLRGLRYLLFFGTLNRLKGMEVISESIGSLVDEFPDLHFVFLGRTMLKEDGQTYTDQLFQENEAWKKNIHYFPSLPKQKLYPVIQHAHGVLIPSLIDNYPNSCLEAMQFGRIVIGTHGSSLDEMVVEGETGFLVDQNEAASLQSGIRKLLGLSAEQKMEMEEKTRKALQGILSEDRIGQLIALYEDTLAAFAPSAGADQLSFENLLIKSKLHKGIRVGMLPGMLVKLAEKCAFARRKHAPQADKGMDGMA